MAASWYYAAGNRQAGPITEAELDSLVASGTIQNDTLVWREGLQQWTPYGVARAGTAEQLAPTRYCTHCGRLTSENELATAGDRLVCVNCNPALSRVPREYAGFWVRVAARLLDSIIIYTAIVPVVFLLVGANAFSYDPSVQGIPPNLLLLQLIVILLHVTMTAVYEVWFLMRYAATPGKLAFGKKVIVADGSALTFGRALARHLSGYLSSFTFGVGYIIAAFDSEKRTLHDFICNTRVVAK